MRRIAANQRDIEPVALVAGAGVGDLVQLDGARAHAPPPSMVTRRTHVLALDQAGGAGEPRRDTAAHAGAAGRTRAIKRLDLVEQKLDRRGIGRLRGKAQPHVRRRGVAAVREAAAVIAEHADDADGVGAELSSGARRRIRSAIVSAASLARAAAFGPA